MSQVKVSPRAIQDLQRLYDFLAEKDERTADNALDTIETAFKSLAHLPEMWRPVEDGLRELIIDYGRSGYLALYEYDPDIDRVIILAVRHQKENDYK